MSRPSGYKKLEREKGQSMADILLPLFEQGYTMEQVAGKFEVTEWTIWNWAHMAGLEYVCTWVRGADKQSERTA